MGLLSAIYSGALSGRRLVYSLQLKKQKKLPVKVISIGNLTLGGTGKTPAVIALAQEAKRRGYQSSILTRGYRGKTKSPCFVSTGEGPVLDVLKAGDEPFLMAERLKGVPVVIGKNRFKSGNFAINKLNSKLQTQEAKLLFILDDGFQHWSLHRDIDILLIDAVNPFGNGKLFPGGILREPLPAMKRAHAIVITKADAVSREMITAISRQIKKYKPGAVIHMSSHKTTSIVNAAGDIKKIDTLTHGPIYAFAGIANPSHFKATLSSKGANIVQFRSFSDHYSYKQRDINKIEKDAAGLDIITTEKDLVKLKRLELPDNIFALRIEFSVEDAFYNHIFDILSKKDVYTAID